MLQCKRGFSKLRSSHDMSENICTGRGVVSNVKSYCTGIPNGVGVTNQKNLPWGEGYGYWFNKYNKSFLTY